MLARVREERGKTLSGKLAVADANQHVLREQPYLDGRESISAQTLGGLRVGRTERVLITTSPSSLNVSACLYESALRSVYEESRHLRVLEKKVVSFSPSTHSQGAQINRRPLWASPTPTPCRQSHPNSDSANACLAEHTTRVDLFVC